MNQLQNKSIAELWKIILGYFNQRVEGYESYLNPPAEMSKISHIEQQMGFEIPQELKELYLCNNGDSEKVNGTFFGLHFLSIEDLYFQWKSWKNIWERETEQGKKDLSEFCTSYPQGAIKEIYSNTMWLPFSYDGAGNHIGFDLDPGEKGNVGQLINFGRDDTDKIVIAQSLKEFLLIMITWLDNHSFTLELYKEKLIFASEENAHPIDMLKKLSRKV